MNRTELLILAVAIILAAILSYPLFAGDSPNPEHDPAWEMR